MEQILQNIHRSSDFRVKDWFLTNYYSPCYISLILFIYLLSAYLILPVIKEFNLIPRRRIDISLQIFNGLLVVINFVLGISYLWNIHKCSYSPWCQDVRAGTGTSTGTGIGIGIGRFSSSTSSSQDTCEDNLANTQWWYFITKLVELFDVVFISLRKTPLPVKQFNAHVYHHSTMLVCSWAAAKYLPGGSSAIMSLINCQMHVLLYFYYFLTSMGCPLFFTFKSVLTIVTAVQFGIVLLVCITGILISCGYPPFAFFVVILLVLSYVQAFFGCFSLFFDLRRAPDENSSSRDAGGDIITSGSSKSRDGQGDASTSPKGETKSQSPVVESRKPETLIDAKDKEI